MFVITFQDVPPPGLIERAMLYGGKVSLTAESKDLSHDYLAKIEMRLNIAQALNLQIKMLESFPSFGTEEIKLLEAIGMWRDDYRVSNLVILELAFLKKVKTPAEEEAVKKIRQALQVFGLDFAEYLSDKVLEFAKQKNLANATRDMGGESE